MRMEKRSLLLLAAALMACFVFLGISEVLPRTRTSLRGSLSRALMEEGEDSPEGGFTTDIQLLPRPST